MNQRKTIKQALSMLLALSLSLCVFFVPAQAEGLKYDAADTAQRVELLRKLGVMEYEVTESMYGEPLNRAQLYGAGLGILGDLTVPLQYDSYTFHDIKDLPEANKIQFACLLGTLEAGWNFEPESEARAGEFIRLLVSCLGYREVAEDRGEGEAGYLSVANRIGLLKGVSVSPNDPLTWETAAAVLYNALDIELLNLIGYESAGVKFLNADGLSALNVYFDIYKVKDVVVANPYTGLGDNNDAGENRVKIGNTVARVGDSNVADLLGYQAEAYLKEADGVYTAIAAYITDNNRIWSIPAEDLMPSDGAWSAYSIVYQDAKGVVKRLSLPASVDVIYNGKALFDYTAGDLNITMGTLTVVDNDGNGTPDVVLVDEYENYIVDSVNASKLVLYSKNKTPLDLNAAESYEFKSVNDDPYPIEEVSEYTIISVSASRDKSLIRGAVVKEKVSGQITGIKTVDGKQVLSLDSNTVTVSRAWNGTDANGNPLTQYDDKPEIVIGHRYLIYLDKNGEAAAFVERSSGMMYGFLYDAAVSGTFSNEITLRLFTDAGVWEDIPVAKKVEVNGVSYQEHELTGLTEVFENPSQAIQQMLKVMVSNDNEISKIYTPVLPEHAQDDNFLTKTGAVSGLYRNGTTALGNFNYLLTGVKIFVLPKNGGVYDDEAFAITGTSALRNDRNYSFAAFYDLSETQIPKVAVMEQAIASADYWTNYASYVRNVLEIYDDGETYIALDCINRGKEVTYLALEDDYIKDVRQGDIILAHLNGAGFIDAPVGKIYDRTVGFAPQEKKDIISGYTDNSQHFAYYGTVKAKDSNAILVDIGGDTKKTFPISSMSNVVACDTKTSDSSEMFCTATVGEIGKESKVIVYTRSGVVCDVAIIEE